MVAGTSSSAYGVGMASPQLVTTAALAAATGLHTRTLQRYRRLGLITPEMVSIGGHARWDVEKVKQQIREILEKQKAENDKTPE